MLTNRMPPTPPFVSEEKHGPTRSLRIAYGLWIALALVVSVKVTLNPNHHSVYPDFTAGARNWWAGLNPWDDTGFFYSPTFAVLFTPFAVLPDRLGGVLWSLTSIAVYLWSLRVFVREVLPAAWSQRHEGAFLILTMIGSTRGIWSAQSTAILMALVLFGIAALVKQRWWSAGLLLAAPVHIKVWPIVIGALLSAHWPRRLAPKLAIGIAAFALVPFLTNAPAAALDSYADYYHFLKFRQTAGERLGGFRDVWTIWEQVSPPVSKAGYSAMQATAGLLALGWCVWQGRRIRSTRQLATYTLAMWTGWQLLFGPGTEVLTNILIAAPLSWGLVTAWSQRRQRALVTLAFAMIYVLGQGEIGVVLARLSPLALTFQPLGALVFVAWLVRFTWNDEAWPADSSDNDAAPPHSDAMDVRRAQAA